MEMKYEVDERAIKYYINRITQEEYLRGNVPQKMNEDVIKRKWNAMVETAFKTGVGVYQRRNDGDEYKVFVGNFKFTVNTETMTIRFVDHESFINIQGEKDFNINKTSFDLGITESLKNMYKQFGLNTLGNRLVLQ